MMILADAKPWESLGEQAQNPHDKTWLKNSQMKYVKYCTENKMLIKISKW